MPQPSSLYDTIEDMPCVEHVIGCETCDVQPISLFSYGRPENASSVRLALHTKAHKLGWRAFDGKAYCPTCAEEKENE